MHSLEALRDTAGDGPLAVQVDGAVSEAGDTLVGAGPPRRADDRAGAGPRPGAHRQPRGQEAARLEQAARRGGSPGMLAEVARSAAAVRDRIAVRDRLVSARATLIARMEAVTLGLEGLVARLAEVLALAGTSGGLDDPVAEISGLAAELEGLRAGLAETEALSRALWTPRPGRRPPRRLPPARAT